MGEEETKPVADNPVLVLQVPAGKKGEPGGLPNFQEVYKKEEEKEEDDEEKEKEDEEKK